MAAETHADEKGGRLVLERAVEVSVMCMLSTILIIYDLFYSLQTFCIYYTWVYGV